MQQLDDLDYDAREAFNDQWLEAARRITPKFCKHCNELEAGTKYNRFDQPELIPVCDKFPEGIPKNFHNCLDMPAICRECYFNTSCHITDGRPILDKDGIAYCQVNNEARIEINNLLINKILFR